MAMEISRFRRGVGRVIQVAERVGIFQVDGGRNYSIAQGKGAKDHFHAAAGAKEMTELALGAGDAQRAGVLLKNGLDGRGFGRVAQARACAMGVDVTDIARVYACIF